MEETNIDETGAPLPEEGQNRTFIILLIAGIVILVLGIACMIGSGIWITQQRKAQNEALQATAAFIETQNALNLQPPPETPAPEATPTPDAYQTSQAALQTALAEAASATPVVPPTATETEATATPEPTAEEPTATPTLAEPEPGIPSEETATPPEGQGGGAEITPSPIPTATPVPGSFTATPTGAPQASMPATGFADQVGVPTLIIMGLALIVVAFVARRVRLSLR